MLNITDTHIHLIAPVNGNVWQWKHPHPLAFNRRLDEYCAEELPASGRFYIDGVIWIEADAVYSLDNGIAGVRAPIDECLYVLRYNHLPNSGEGTARPGYIKAMVPWAPVPWGKRLAEYEGALKNALQEEFRHVKGFRFLLQDKKPGTMTQDSFVEGLRWMQEHDYVFEWGIDIHNGGIWQFEESVLVFQKAPGLKYIINHLTKPAVGTPAQDSTFLRWKELMTQMRQAAPNSYMKVSGCFSEFDTLLSALETARQVFPWFEVCFKLWGTSHMIWGSNWPVCSIKAGHHLTEHWFSVTEELFDMVLLLQADRNKIYSENYVAAYNL